MMTLSSITADVRESASPMPTMLHAKWKCRSVRTIHSALASAHTHISWCGALRLHKYDFFFSSQRSSTAIRFLAASVAWCSVSGVNAPAPSRRHHTYPVPCHLIPNSIGIKPDSMTFPYLSARLMSRCQVKGWARLSVWSLGASRSLFFSGPGCLSCSPGPPYPQVSRYWDGSQRANCVINNRGPMQREARWVYWGRELSPSQCWIDVTEMRGAPRGGAAPSPQTHTHTHSQFVIITAIISRPKNESFHSLIFCVWASSSQHPHLLLLLMCHRARHTLIPRRLQGCWCATDRALCRPQWAGKDISFIFIIITIRTLVIVWECAGPDHMDGSHRADCILGPSTSTFWYFAHKMNLNRHWTSVLLHCIIIK